MKKSLSLLIIVIMVIVGFGVWTPKVKADYAPSFGGYVAGIVPCTCAAATYSMYIMIKAYIVPSAVPLTPVVPMPALFLNAFTTMPTVYQQYAPITPGRFILGHYYPLTAPCLVGIPPICIPLPLPILGQIGPDSGTSLPTSPVGP